MLSGLKRINPFSLFKRENSRFTLLLVFLALQGIVSSLAGNSLVVQKIVYFYTYLVFLSAISAIVEHKIRLYIFAGLFVFSLICSLLFFRTDFMFLLAASEIADMIMLFMTAMGIMRFMFRQKIVTGDLIAGAICIYMLIGLIWTNIYTLCVMADHHAVSGLTGISNVFTIKKNLTYFSFITMLTIGYGDMHPVSDLAKSFTVLQGVFGQMYIAVFVASVIGIFLSQDGKSRLRFSKLGRNLTNKDKRSMKN